MREPFDLGNVLPPWGDLLDVRPRRFVALGQEFILNPAATDAGRRAVHTEQPATREALGAEPPATVPCDCPGCAPRVRYARTLTVPSREDVLKALSAIAVANAIRFAGLNTPDRKQMGAAQTLGGACV